MSGGVSPAIGKRLNEAINKIADLPAMKALCLTVAQRTVTGTPEQFAALLNKDWDDYGKLVQAPNLKLE